MRVGVSQPIRFSDSPLTLIGNPRDSVRERILEFVIYDAIPITYLLPPMTMQLLVAFDEYVIEDGIPRKRSRGSAYGPSSYRSSFSKYV